MAAFYLFDDDVYINLQIEIHFHINSNIFTIALPILLRKLRRFLVPRNDSKRG